MDAHLDEAWQDSSGESHMIPANDEIEHDLDAECECGPVPVEALGEENVLNGTIYMHRAMDMRHLVAQGEAIKEHQSAVLAHQFIDKNPKALVQSLPFHSGEEISLPPAQLRINRPK